jgi:hypothetical protein
VDLQITVTRYLARSYEVLKGCGYLSLASPKDDVGLSTFDQPGPFDCFVPAEGAPRRQPLNPNPAMETWRRAEISASNRSVLLHMHNKLHRRVARAAEVPAHSTKIANFVGDKCHFHRLAFAHLLLHL